MPPVTRKSKRREPHQDKTQKTTKSLEHTHTKFEALQRTIFANYLTKRFSNKADWKKVVWATSFRVKNTKLWLAYDFDPPNYKTIAYAKMLKSEINRIFTQHKQKKPEAILQTDPNCTDGAGYRWIHSTKNPLGGFIFGWPNKSMDLHPMTPIVQQFKQMLPDLEELNKADKTEAIKATWEAVSKKDIANSIDQMPHRLNAVLESQGQAIADDYYTYCLNASEFQEYAKESTKYEKSFVFTISAPTMSNR